MKLSLVFREVLFNLDVVVKLDQRVGQLRLARGSLLGWDLVSMYHLRGIVLFLVCDHPVFDCSLEPAERQPSFIQGNHPMIGLIAMGCRQAGDYWYLHRVAGGKTGLQTKVVLLRERIKLVIVAARTPQAQTQEC